MPWLRNTIKIGSLILFLPWVAAAQNYDTNLINNVPSPGGVILPRGPVNLVVNGSFEMNDGVGGSMFNGWTTVNQAAGGGAWVAQSGTSTPISGSMVEPPPDGSFAAMADQSGAGSHALYQDIVIPPEGASLLFDLYINNQASDFSVPTPETLDSQVIPNQQFRADIIDPAAGDFDLGAAVLLNVYQTNPGDALVSGYTTITADLNAFAGQTVRLRFVEVDNQFFFNVGIDNVTVVPTAPLFVPVDVPTLDRTAMLVLALLLLSAGVWLQRRKA